MQLTQPVPSSIVNLRNLFGLCSREVTRPRISARERDLPRREKQIGSEEKKDGVWRRERRSKARSFTCVYWNFGSICRDFQIIVGLILVSWLALRPATRLVVGGTKVIANTSVRNEL